MKAINHRYKKLRSQSSSSVCFTKFLKNDHKGTKTRLMKQLFRNKTFPFKSCWITTPFPLSDFQTFLWSCQIQKSGPSPDAAACQYPSHHIPKQTYLINNNKKQKRHGIRLFFELFLHISKSQIFFRFEFQLF